MSEAITPARRGPMLTAAFLTVAMAATVGSALAFQYIGGYIPCKLCYEQRIPYYVGAPLMLLAVLAAVFKLPVWITRALLIVGGLLMVYGLYLGVFHSGVEWGWWPGPTDCTNVAGPVDTGGNGVLDALDKFVPPSCDKAALRILGLSLAGWNAIASVILAAVAFRGAFKRG
ncbi:MAG TPA: disulfide bond formation protein B [Mesorhizobium sp.]|uniref:disulfide bond formation protein B n=1 Tax=Mesorhizobium sp. TaxID=1871066 RepID=UPI002DDDBAC7|nr:disulfide bond formation protein B [Mesorhizobium sp.]HEV2506096.1 disulfide bond formation protein B [Mesorhizobium sp.]